MFAKPSKFAFIVIFLEMAVNLAYFKDVVFSFSTLVNFGGMWKVSNDLINAEGTNESVIPYAESTR